MEIRGVGAEILIVVTAVELLKWDTEAKVEKTRTKKLAGLERL